MTGITQAGSTPRTTTASNLKVGLSEAELTKNLGLIEKTVDRALADIESAVKSLKQLGENSFTSESRAGETGFAAGSGGCFPTEKPEPVIAGDPLRTADKLKVDSNGTITTPGGYKIEQLGQFEWKISGPDGKSTRVWGDPHVDESDGGKFDFKRNTTFALPDGTEIHVTTKPWGNGMTVTGELSITNGDDHIKVTDIDKGKGKVGELTKDGYEAKVGFRWDDFQNTDANLLVMGQESDDWSHLGKEVTGDEGGGDKFKTGKDLVRGELYPTLGKVAERTKEEPAQSTSSTSTKPATKKPTKQEVASTRDALLSKISEALGRVFDTLKGVKDEVKADKAEARKQLETRFKNISKLFRAVDEIQSLNDMVKTRNVFF
ncbi:DUF1521 domain-containing protein [Myxococcus sp. K15C18031901]|uniref:DUF1521 domain-containing protein n=1 Tax=Myxococcus dinghuensis TaxID=2906761 RepID=UPI0020A7E65D|nr:DUF1521 domain-containing protein [Myxococcus dinghuensis]MCP3097633.1 DUF1521 domain-containing protein [Myxococcus dinghuensis]